MKRERHGRLTDREKKTEKGKRQHMTDFIAKINTNHTKHWL